MTDLAVLGIKVDATDADVAAGKLDKLTAAGIRAEAATDKLGNTSSDAAKNLETASDAADEMAQSALAQAGASQAGAAGATAQAAALTATATASNAAAASVARLAGGAALVALAGVATVVTVALAGVALAAGVLVGSFALFAAQVNQSGQLKEYAASLGLTKEEMKQLGDVSLTATDVIKGVWNTFAEIPEIAALLEWLRKTAISTFTAMLDYGKIAVAGIYAGFAGTFNAITIIWERLPAIMGAAIGNAANLVITGAEMMVNQAIAGINTLVTAVNAAVAAVGLPFKLGTIEAVKFGRVAIDSAGSISKAAADIGAGYAGAYRQATSFMEGFQDKAEARILRDKQQQISAAAEAIKANRASVRAASEHAKAVGDVVDEVRSLFSSYDALQKSLNVVERSMEKAFGKDARDWIKGQAKEINDLIDQIRAGIDAKPGQLDIDKATREANEQATREMLDNLDAIANRAADVGQIMRDAFGGVGGVFGDLIANMADYRSEYEKMAAQVKAGTRTQISMDAELAGMQARNTAQMIGGVKSLFKEKSAAYKALDAIEKVHAALQFANMVKAMVMDATRTTTEVASAGVRATAKGAEGAATIFAALGPFGFPVVAAMVAVLAAMGVKGLGGGGGGGAVKPPSAEDVQAAIGTGTVLGDGSAQSDSISKALDIIASNTNEDLEYSNESVGYLRSIASGIQDLAGLVSRQIGLGGGMFDTAGLGLGQSSKSSLGGSGILGAVGAILFGKTTTTRTLFDQGLEMFQTSVGEALMQGVNAQAYAIVEQVRKKSGFLGIGGGTKTTYETSTGAVSTAIEQQFQLIIDDITKSVIAFGDQLGIDVSEQVKNVMLPAAKLSFLDMSGEEIQDALEAYFSSVADVIATTLNSDGLDLNALQKVGEGLYETLARVVRTLTTVNVSLSSIGMGPLSVGGNAGANVTAPAADNLVGLFGGLDAFRDAVNQFSEDFLTDAERMAPVISAVQREMARLGLAGVTTNDQFKQLVLGLDLGTESGQQMFASLMAVAPAFAKVNEYLASLNGELGSTGKTAAELAAIAKQSRSLDIQLMEALGNAAGALAAKRADELAAMDESLRAKQQEVWDAQDAAQATREATALAKTQRQMEIQIMELQGDASGALAARRAIELASIDETLRPLQERIYALEDEKTAQDEANAALKAAQTLASERRGLEIQIMELTGDAAGALAARRADELAALDPSLRALQERIYALEDERDAVTQAADAARNAREVAKTGRDMEIRIMELSGDAAGALAARRAEELAALDPSLRGLQLRIYALEDEKTATDALTEALRTEQELTKTRRSMEIELMRALGDESGALAAQRELELAALDPSLHALQRAIWTAQDATKAQNDLADAQSEAARTAQAMANLNIRLLEAQGNDTAALAARRQLELSQATDDATRSILLEIYAAEDLAKVKAKEADAARQAIQDAQEAARAAAEIAKQRTSLEIQLMRLTGNEAAATAAQRELELAAMDESLHALQLQVWAAEDAKAAVEAHAKAVSDARDVLSQAYERESEALKDTIERFSSFSASLREFRATLYDGANGIGDLYRQTQAIFVDTAAAARMGDADALGKLAGVSKEFLDASRGRATSLIEYQRDVARVARAVDAGITASDEVVDYAQAQLDALNESVKGILDVNETLTSVHDALIAYLRVTSGQVLAPASTPIPVPPVTTPSPAPVAAQPGSASSEDISGLVEEIRTLSIPQVAALNKLLRIAERWDGEGMPVRNNDAGDNLNVEVTA